MLRKMFLLHVSFIREQALRNKTGLSSPFGGAFLIFHSSLS